jgi:signal peptidase II
VALTVVGVDQLSKWFVVEQLAYLERVPFLPFLTWVHWTNTGAAFSFLAGAGGWQRWVFVALALGFSLYLIYEIVRMDKSERYLPWVFGLILGGAVGNLADRLTRGHVVDFIYFNYQQYDFPAFNVADSALFCGAALWILLMIIEHRQASQSDVS